MIIHSISSSPPSPSAELSFCTVTVHADLRHAGGGLAGGGHVTGVDASLVQVLHVQSTERVISQLPAPRAASRSYRRHSEFKGTVPP